MNLVYSYTHFHVMITDHFDMSLHNRLNARRFFSSNGLLILILILKFFIFVCMNNNLNARIELKPTISFKTNTHRRKKVLAMTNQKKVHRYIIPIFFIVIAHIYVIYGNFKYIYLCTF
jgi:hypothetical protein